MIETFLPNQPDRAELNEKLCTVLVQSYLYNLIELYKKKSTTDAILAEEETVWIPRTHTRSHSPVVIDVHWFIFDM